MLVWAMCAPVPAVELVELTRGQRRTRDGGNRVTAARSAGYDARLHRQQRTQAEWDRVWAEKRKKLEERRSQQRQARRDGRQCPASWRRAARRRVSERKS